MGPQGRVQLGSPGLRPAQKHSGACGGCLLSLGHLAVTGPRSLPLPWLLPATARGGEEAWAAVVEGRRPREPAMDGSELLLWPHPRAALLFPAPPPAFPHSRAGPARCGSLHC